MTVRIESVNINQVNNNKKSDPVTKGARIGAGVALGIQAADMLVCRYNLKKTTGQGLFKNMMAYVDKNIETYAKEYKGNKKARVLLAAAAGLGAALCIAIQTGIGAAAGGGLGLLVKGHNQRKEAQKQEIVEQVKTELTEDINAAELKDEADSTEATEETKEETNTLAEAEVSEEADEAADTEEEIIEE